MNETSNTFELIKSKWAEMSEHDRIDIFIKLERSNAEDLFLSLSPVYQTEILKSLPETQWRAWIRMLPLDETADVIQLFPSDQQTKLLDLLDRDTKREVQGLLAYSEDDAGGLMTPQYIRFRPDMVIESAIRYLRTYSRYHERTIYYCYVVNQENILLGVVSFRELLLANQDKTIENIMIKKFVSVLDTMDQEEVARVFQQSSLSAIPVLNVDGKILGIVTYDDIAAVVQDEATEDIQKIGGMEALDMPYWKTSFFTMLRKRAGWLVILFFGEMFTATAMAHYEDAIKKAIVLALFIPLIISSGGNSGSQASTLIIRAMALGEIKLKHWWKVFFRELGAGLVLGLILGIIGFLRVLIWPNRETIYGQHYGLVAVTIAFSLVGVVLWGATAGSMLPFALKKLGLDPASASAPFVATLVDVTGLVIYFSVASAVLTGTLM